MKTLKKYLHAFMLILSTCSLWAQQDTETPSLSDKFKNSTGIFTDRTGKTFIADKKEVTTTSESSIFLDFKISPDNLFACALTQTSVKMYEIIVNENGSSLNEKAEYNLNGLASPTTITFSKDASTLFVAGSSEVFALSLKKSRTKESFLSAGQLSTITELKPYAGEVFTNLEVGPTGRYLYWVAENKNLPYKYKNGHLTNHNFNASTSFGSFGAWDLELQVSVLRRPLVRPREVLANKFSIEGGGIAFLGPYNLTISPDENYAIISAAGGKGAVTGGYIDPVQGVRPASDDNNGGLLFIDIRNNGEEKTDSQAHENAVGILNPIPPYRVKVGSYLYYIPSRIRNQANIMSRYMKYAFRNQHPLVTAFEEIAESYEDQASAFSTGIVGASVAADNYINAARARGISQIYADVYKNFGLLGAYRNIYTNDMIAPYKMALSPLGNQALVPMRWTNNFGVLKLSLSQDYDGFNLVRIPTDKIYFEAALEKSISFSDLNFDHFGGDFAPSPYDDVWPEFAGMSPDSSISYFGIKGNRFGFVTRDSLNAYMEDYHYIITEHIIDNLPETAQTTENPPPVFTPLDKSRLNKFKDRRFKSRESFLSALQLTDVQKAYLETLAGTPVNFIEQAIPKQALTLSNEVDAFTPRKVATFTNPNADEDLFSDQVEAYNRFNTLNEHLTAKQKKELYSNEFAELTNNSVFNDLVDLKVLMPQKGLGYELLSPLGFNRANATLSATARLLERLGQHWHVNHVKEVEPYKSQPNIRILALSAIDGGNIVNDEGETAIKATTGGFSIFIPYFHKTAGKGIVDFVLNNDTNDAQENSEAVENLDTAALASLITELLLSPEVEKIEIDPKPLAMLKEFSNDEIFNSPKFIVDSEVNNFTNRTLDSYFKVQVNEFDVKLVAYEGISETDFNSNEDIKTYLAVAPEDMRQPFGPGVKYNQGKTFIEVKTPGFNAQSYHTFTPTLETDNGLTVTDQAPFQVTGLTLPEDQKYLDLRLKMVYTHTGKTRTYYYSRLSVIKDKAQLFVSSSIPKFDENGKIINPMDGSILSSNQTVAGDPVTLLKGSKLTLAVDENEDILQRIFYDSENLILQDANGNDIKSGSLLQSGTHYTFAWKNDTSSQVLSTSVKLKIYNKDDGTFLSEDEVFFNNPVRESIIAVDTTTQTEIKISDYYNDLEQVKIEILPYEKILKDLEEPNGTFESSIPEELLPQAQVYRKIEENQAPTLILDSAASPTTATGINITDKLLIKGLLPSNYKGDLAIKISENNETGTPVFYLRLSVYRTDNFEAITGVSPSSTDIKAIPGISIARQVNIHNQELILTQAGRSVIGNQTSASATQTYRTGRQFSPNTGFGWTAGWDSHFIRKSDGSFIYRLGDGSAWNFPVPRPYPKEGDKDYPIGIKPTPLGDTEKKFIFEMPVGFNYVSEINVDSQSENTEIILTNASGSELHFLGSSDSEIRLQSITDRYGNSITYDYAEGLVKSITNDRGQGLYLSYENTEKLKNSIISKITDSVGTSYEFSYGLPNDESKPFLNRVKVSSKDSEGKTLNRYLEYSYDKDKHYQINKIEPRGDDPAQPDTLIPIAARWETEYFNEIADSSSFYPLQFFIDKSYLFPIYSLKIEKDSEEPTLIHVTDGNGIKTTYEYYEDAPSQNGQAFASNLCKRMFGYNKAPNDPNQSNPPDVADSKKELKIYNENLLLKERTSPLGAKFTIDYFLVTNHVEVLKVDRRSIGLVSKTSLVKNTYNDESGVTGSSQEPLESEIKYFGADNYFRIQEQKATDETVVKFEYIDANPDNNPPILETIISKAPDQSVTVPTDQKQITQQSKLDNLGRLKETIDNNGNKTTYTYQELDSGKLKVVVEAKGQERTLTSTSVRDIYGSTLESSNSADAKIEYTYDAFGYLTQVLHPPVAENDTLRAKETFKYHENGLVKENLWLTVIPEKIIPDAPNKAVPHLTEYRYDSHQRETESTKTINGKKTLLSHYKYGDGKYRLAFEKFENGTYKHYRYNSKGLLSGSLNGHTEDSWEDGNPNIEGSVATFYNYDVENRLTTIEMAYGTNAKVPETAYHYDFANRPILEVDLIGTYFNISLYNNKGQLFNKKTIYNTVDGHNVLSNFTFAYHPNGDRYTIKDELRGVTTRSSYDYKKYQTVEELNGASTITSKDNFGLTKTIQKAHSAIAFKYNKQGFKVATAPGSSATQAITNLEKSTQHEFDKVGNVVKITNPETEFEQSFNVTQEGQPAVIKIGNKKSTVIEFDDEGRAKGVKENAQTDEERSTKVGYNPSQRISTMVRKKDSYNHLIVQTLYDRYNNPVKRITNHDFYYDDEDLNKFEEINRFSVDEKEVIEYDEQYRISRKEVTINNKTSYLKFEYYSDDYVFSGFHAAAMRRKLKKISSDKGVMREFTKYNEFGFPTEMIEYNRVNSNNEVSTVTVTHEYYRHAADGHNFGRLKSEKTKIETKIPGRPENIVTENTVSYEYDENGHRHTLTYPLEEVKVTYDWRGDRLFSLTKTDQITQKDTLLLENSFNLQNPHIVDNKTLYKESNSSGTLLTLEYDSIVRGLPSTSYFVDKESGLEFNVNNYTYTPDGRLAEEGWWEIDSGSYDMVYEYDSFFRLAKGLLQKAGLASNELSPSLSNPVTPESLNFRSAPTQNDPPEPEPQPESTVRNEYKLDSFDNRVGKNIIDGDEIIYEVTQDNKVESFNADPNGVLSRTATVFDTPVTTVALKYNFTAPLGENEKEFGQYIIESGLSTAENSLAYGWQLVDETPVNVSENARHENRLNPIYSSIPLKKDDQHFQWQQPLPNGKYKVKISAGNSQAEDPLLYKIKVENELVLDAQSTSDNFLVESEYVTVEVTDGSLTVSSADQTLDNHICSIEIIVQTEQQAQFSFQPAVQELPINYFVDSGDGFNNTNWLSYGWYDQEGNIKTLAPVQTQGFLDPKYTSYISMDNTSKWEVAIPNGTYFVELTAGVLNADSQKMNFQVEEKHLFNSWTAEESSFTGNIKGLLKASPRPVIVEDGRLTITTSGTDQKLAFVKIHTLNVLPVTDPQASYNEFFKYPRSIDEKLARIISSPTAGSYGNSVATPTAGPNESFIPNPLDRKDFEVRYDKQGRVVEDAFFFFKWDDFGRLTFANYKGITPENTPGTVYYLYDTLGRRVAHLYGGTNHNWNSKTLVYDGILHVIEEQLMHHDTNLNQELMARYYFENRPNYLVAAELNTNPIDDSEIDQKFGVLTDRRGTVMGLVDPDSNMVEAVIPTNPDGLIKNFIKVLNVVNPANFKNTFEETVLLGEKVYRSRIPFGHTGLYVDKFTGLVHSHFRDMDPISNRWYSKDSAGFMDGLNLYANYAGVNGRDRDGQVVVTGSVLLGLAVKSILTYVATQAAFAAAETGIEYYFYDGEEGDFGPGTTFAKNFGLNLATGGIGGKTKLFGKALGQAGSFALRNSIEVGIETAFDVGYRERDFGDSLLMNGIGSVGGELLVKGLMSRFKGGRKEYSYSGKLCFIAGTKVKTDQGYKNIEDIKIGDMVWSKDDSGQESREAYKPVKTLFTTKPTQLVHLSYKARDSISGEDDDHLQTLTGTPNHPFWSVDRQEWIEMGDLLDDEQLLLSNQQTAYVISKKFENAKSGEHFTTYNFEVEDYHTYFVAPKNSPPNSSFIWVHNEGTLCPDGKAEALRLVKEEGMRPSEAIRLVKSRGVAPSGGLYQPDLFKQAKNDVWWGYKNGQMRPIGSTNSKVNPLRAEFDSTVRKHFIKALGSGSTPELAAMKSEMLKRGVLKEKHFAKMVRTGKMPDDWQIHHIKNLQYGGDNAFSNLIPLRDKGFHHAEGIFGILHSDIKITNGYIRWMKDNGWY